MKLLSAITRRHEHADDEAFDIELDAAQRYAQMIGQDKPASERADMLRRFAKSALPPE